mgnify:CR=1 FL=1
MKLRQKNDVSPTALRKKKFPQFLSPQIIKFPQLFLPPKIPRLIVRLFCLRPRKTLNGRTRHQILMLGNCDSETWCVFFLRNLPYLVILQPLVTVFHVNESSYNVIITYSVRISFIVSGPWVFISPRNTSKIRTIPTKLYNFTFHMRGSYLYRV